MFCSEKRFFAVPIMQGRRSSSDQHLAVAGDGGTGASPVPRDGYIDLRNEDGYIDDGVTFDYMSEDDDDAVDRAAATDSTMWEVPVCGEHVARLRRISPSGRVTEFSPRLIGGQLELGPGTSTLSPPVRHIFGSHFDRCPASS